MPTSQTPRPLDNVDERLCEALRTLSDGKPHYWSHRYGRSSDEQPYFEYPARMIAPVQRDILSVVRTLQPEIATCYEPFAGSGTVLLECLAQGLSPVGQDVNPLAILLCRARTDETSIEDLTTGLDAVLGAASADKSNAIEVDFPGVAKWFRLRARRELSKLRRAIREIGREDVRRFLWVCLAETIRRTSNSRTSTYKLHVRPPDEIAALPLPLDTFVSVTKTNLTRHARVRKRLDAFRPLDTNIPPPRATIRLQDSMLPAGQVFDLVMTSPPYGDNTSTVPYGQQAYLPLQWIIPADIDAGAAVDDFLRTTHEIDRRSLGGEKFRGDFSERFGDLLGRSEHVAEAVCALASRPPNYINKVLSFLLDLDRAASSIALATRTNAYSVWTVGNRRVGDIELPFDQIMIDLFDTHELQYVTRVTRQIHSKRMPARNSFSKTMSQESVLIFRKRSAS